MNLHEKGNTDIMVGDKSDKETTVVIQIKCRNVNICNKPKNKAIQKRHKNNHRAKTAPLPTQKYSQKTEKKTTVQPKQESPVDVPSKQQSPMDRTKIHVVDRKLSSRSSESPLLRDAESECELKEKSYIGRLDVTNLEKQAHTKENYNLEMPWHRDSEIKSTPVLSPPGRIGQTADVKLDPHCSETTENVYCSMVTAPGQAEKIEERNAMNEVHHSLSVRTVPENIGSFSCVTTLGDSFTKPDIEQEPLSTLNETVGVEVNLSLGQDKTPCDVTAGGLENRDNSVLTDNTCTTTESKTDRHSVSTSTFEIDDTISNASKAEYNINQMVKIAVGDFSKIPKQKHEAKEVGGGSGMADSDHNAVMASISKMTDTSVEELVDEDSISKQKEMKDCAKAKPSTVDCEMKASALKEIPPGHHEEKYQISTEYHGDGIVEKMDNGPIAVMKIMALLTVGLFYLAVARPTTGQALTSTGESPFEPVHNNTSDENIFGCPKHWGSVSAEANQTGTVTHSSDRIVHDQLGVYGENVSIVKVSRHLHSQVATLQVRDVHTFCFMLITQYQTIMKSVSISIDVSACIGGKLVTTTDRTVIGVEQNLRMMVTEATVTKSTAQIAIILISTEHGAVGHELDSFLQLLDYHIGSGDVFQSLGMPNDNGKHMTLMSEKSNYILSQWSSSVMLIKGIPDVLHHQYVSYADNLVCLERQPVGNSEICKKKENHTTKEAFVVLLMHQYMNFVVSMEDQNVPEHLAKGNETMNNVGGKALEFTSVLTSGCITQTAGLKLDPHLSDTNGNDERLMTTAPCHKKRICAYLQNNSDITTGRLYSERRLCDTIGCNIKLFEINLIKLDFVHVIHFLVVAHKLFDRESMTDMNNANIPLLYAKMIPEVFCKDQGRKNENKLWADQLGEGRTMASSKLWKDEFHIQFVLNVRETGFWKQNIFTCSESMSYLCADKVHIFTCLLGVEGTSNPEFKNIVNMSSCHLQVETNTNDRTLTEQQTNTGPKKKSRVFYVETYWHFVRVQVVKALMVITIVWIQILFSKNIRIDELSHVTIWKDKSKTDGRSELKEKGVALLTFVLVLISCFGCCHGVVEIKIKNSTSLPDGFDPNQAMAHPCPGDTEVLRDALQIELRQFQHAAADPFVDLPSDDLLTSDEYPISSLVSDEMDSADNRINRNHYPMQGARLHIPPPQPIHHNVRNRPHDRGNDIQVGDVIIANSVSNTNDDIFGDEDSGAMDFEVERPERPLRPNLLHQPSLSEQVAENGQDVCIQDNEHRHQARPDTDHLDDITEQPEAFGFGGTTMEQVRVEVAYLDRVSSFFAETFHTLGDVWSLLLSRVTMLYQDDDNDFVIYEDVGGRMHSINFRDMDQSLYRNRLFVIIPILYLHMGDKDYPV